MPAIPKRIINMKHYYVNKNPQIRGEHEVHSSGLHLLANT